MEEMHPRQCDQRRLGQPYRPFGESRLLLPSERDMVIGRREVCRPATGLQEHVGLQTELIHVEGIIIGDGVVLQRELGMVAIHKVVDAHVERIA